MPAAGYFFILFSYIMKKNKSKKSKKKRNRKKKFRSPNAIDASRMAAKKGGPILDKEEKFKNSKFLRKEDKKIINEGLDS